MTMIILKKIESIIGNSIIYNGETVGKIQICPERNEIINITIDEGYRNNGIGTQVIRYLIETGIRTAYVRSDNFQAIHVFEKCGFVKEGSFILKMEYKGRLNSGC